MRQEMDNTKNDHAQPKRRTNNNTKKKDMKTNQKEEKCDEGE